MLNLNEMAYVYLLCDSGHDNVFKIGVTKGSIEKRIKKLQTGNGDEIFLVDYYETEHPFYIEKIMHQRHYPEHKLNEWFELKPESVFDFRKECEEIEKIIKDLEDNPFFKINK